MKSDRHRCFTLLMLVWSLSACTPKGVDFNDIVNDLEQRTGQRFSEAHADEVIWPAHVSIEDGLSEDEWVSLALSNNADFRVALADLGLVHADLVQASQLPNPTFSMLVPWGAKPLELTLRYPLEIFWLRPERVKLATLDLEQTAHQLVQTGLDLIRDVKLADIELCLIQARLQIAQASAALNRDIAELIQARLRAGDASELEVTHAQVDVLQANEQSRRLEHDAKIACERLRHWVGLILEECPIQMVDEPISNNETFDIETLVAEALLVRPDLRAAKINVETAGKRIGLAHAEIFNLTTILNAKQINGPILAGPGLDVTLPILNQNQGGIAKAQARFDKAVQQYIATRQRMIRDVREAHVRFQQAQESLKQWQQIILPPLQTAINDAQKAYIAGNVTYLFVLETQRRWLDAQLKTAQAVADYRRARAELERSVGQHLKPA